jgi:hypothetical protein
LFVLECLKSVLGTLVNKTHINKIRVGNGVDTFFWTNMWLEGVPFCVKFSRLFNLSENKLSTIADMRGLGWEEGGAAWQWCRRLWASEEEFIRECRSLLHDISL